MCDPADQPVMTTLAPPLVEPLEGRCLWSAAPAGSPAEADAAVPRPDHVVIVVEENRSFADVLPSAPPLQRSRGTVPWAPPPPPRFLDTGLYIRDLAAGGAVFTNSYALTHPSQPNYIELFSGSNQGVTTNATPAEPITAPSLGGQLFAAGLSFAGYAESLPAPGSTVAQEGPYVRRHNPWVNFADVPPSANLPFTHFPTDFSQLPTVSFVVPNLINDMHDASIEVGDQWLRANLGAYAEWAQTHNSLLIVTFDEGLGSLHIPTIFYGQPVQPGVYSERIDHHRVLRTLEDMYGLAPLGAAANVVPITSVWR